MLLERFIKYVKIDTQSDDLSESSPSTSKQWDLLNLLKSELDELGVQNELTNTGRLYGFIPGNEEIEPIGVCAHVDTATDFSGTNVNPQIVENYNGKKIRLGDSKRVLDPEEYKVLNTLKGKTLITTDGNTLLGADDKAGVSIIMEVVEAILKLDQSERRPMYILFTPDEEVGRGAEEFDTEKLDDIFGLMQLMGQFELRCNYYPYGENFHIAFYDEVEKALPAFEHFLQENQREHGDIIPITPNIEDCFIELIQMTVEN